MTHASWRDGQDSFPPREAGLSLRESERVRLPGRKLESMQKWERQGWSWAG